MQKFFFIILIGICPLLHAQGDSDADLIQKAKEGNLQALFVLATTSEERRNILIEMAEKSEFAQMVLGVVCEKNEDYKQAIVWFTKAGEQGNGEAWYTIGNFYMDGLGVDRDLKKAFEYWLKGANGGDVNAMTMVGNVYSEGLGIVDIDVYRAFEYYKMSAELGCSTGQFHLGECYQKGIGVSKNLTEAKKWFQRSAEQGEERAIKSLKEM